MGDTGPCGRCSEIHYFRGNQHPCEEEQRGRTCRGLDCSCDRFVEIWNNVFMEFDRQADGTLNPLPAPSIERAAKSSCVRMRPSEGPCSEPMRFCPPSPRVIER